MTTVPRYVVHNLIINNNFTETPIKIQTNQPTKDDTEF